MSNLKDMAIKLAEYRNKNGFQWRKKLKESLLNSTQREPLLAHFRNKFNFDTLDKIKTVSTTEEIESLLVKYSRWGLTSSNRYK